MSTQKDSKFKFATVSIALARKFNNDYKSVMEKYAPDLQLAITSHLEQVLKSYLESPEHGYKEIYEAEMVLFEKYGSAMKHYSDMQFHKYFQPDIVLAEKEIFSTEEWNSLIDGQQEVSGEEMTEFINLILGQIGLSRRFMLLNRQLDDATVPKEKQKKEEGNEQTRARQLLAIYFLLKSLDIEHRADTSISAVARLIHLVSNTALTNLQNSDIYKKYREMPYYKKGKELLTDLQYIRPYFEDIGLKSVVTLIDSEITKLQKQ